MRFALNPDCKMRLFSVYSLGSVVANLHSIVNLAARKINTRDELEEV